MGGSCPPLCLPQPPPHSTPEQPFLKQMPGCMNPLLTTLLCFSSRSGPAPHAPPSLLRPSRNGPWPVCTSPTQTCARTSPHAGQAGFQSFPKTPSPQGLCTCCCCCSDNHVPLFSHESLQFLLFLFVQTLPPLRGCKVLIRLKECSFPF